MKVSAISDREMRRINSGDLTVQVLQATADEVRTLMDQLDVDQKELGDALDEVQGGVFSGQEEVAYLVLKVTNKA